MDPVSLANHWQRSLANALNEALQCDLMAKDLTGEAQQQCYYDRGVAVYRSLYLAARLHWPCGLRIDPAEPNWPVAYIQLPFGQVSWHMMAHPYPYDGHGTEEKWSRLKEFIRSELGSQFPVAGS